MPGGHPVQPATGIMQIRDTDKIPLRIAAHIDQLGIGVIQKHLPRRPRQDIPGIES